MLTAAGPAHATIDVWRTRVSAAPVDELAAVLDAAESAAARRFTFDKDRRQYIVARGTLRRLLARALGIDPADVAFIYGPQGKPALKREPGLPDLRFNVSHARDVILIACAVGRDVGVDVESHDAPIDMQALAPTIFSPAELRHFLAANGDQRQALFFRYWTAKEAYIKLVGGGLSVPLQEFTVELSSNTGTWPVITANSPRHVAPVVTGLRMPDGYAGAVAAVGHDWRATLTDLA